MGVEPAQFAATGARLARSNVETIRGTKRRPPHACPWSAWELAWSRSTPPFDLPMAVVALLPTGAGTWLFR